MSEQGFGLTRKSAMRVKQTVDLTLGTLGRVPQVKRRRYDDEAGNPVFQSTGGSCGCCDPTNCAGYTQPLANSDCEEGPFGWEVNFGNDITLNQLCTGLPLDGNGAFELSYVDYGVWRSETFTCPGSSTVGGCNDEAATDCCTGSVTYTLTDGVWVSGGSGDCSEGCSESSAAPQCLTQNGGMPYNEGDTQTRPCVDTTATAIFIRSGGQWVRTGGACDEGTTGPATNPDISCDGELYEVPCCGDATPVGDGDQYSYIQLTVNNARNSDNRSQTKLELIVGGVAAFTYVLPIGRDFCCTCEQKFELKCCGPWAFRFLPESICLRPMSPLDFDELYVDAPEGIDCCVVRVEDNKMPRFFEFEIEMSDGTHPCCAGNASGQFILEWDGNLAGLWVSAPLVVCPLNSTPGPFAGDCVATTPPGEPPGSGDNSETFYQWRLGCGGGQMGLEMRVWERVDTPGVGGECTAYGTVGHIAYELNGSTQDCNDVDGFELTYTTGGAYCGTYPATIRVYPMVTS